MMVMQLFSSAGGGVRALALKGRRCTAQRRRLPALVAGTTVAEVLKRWSKRGAVVHSKRGGYSGEVARGAAPL